MACVQNNIVQTRSLSAFANRVCPKQFCLDMVVDHVSGFVFDARADGIEAQ